MASPIKSIEILDPTTIEGGTPEPSLHITAYAYGDLKSSVLHSWIDLSSHLSTSKRPASLRTIREDALISRSRCRATQFFLLDDKDVWIQLDHDIQFDTKDLLAIANLSHLHQAAVCIPYSCRSLPPRPAHRPKPDAQPLEDNPSLTPITFFASGAVAIPKPALQQALQILEQDVTPHPYRIEWCQDQMVDKFPTLWMPFVMETAKGKEYLSEDYAASARLALMDVPQLAYTPDTPLQHWGDFNFKL